MGLATLTKDPREVVTMWQFRGRRYRVTTTGGIARFEIQGTDERWRMLAPTDGEEVLLAGFVLLRASCDDAVSQAAARFRERRAG